MTGYKKLETTEEFAKFMKALYSPSNEKIDELSVPKMKYLVVNGRGAPGSPAFQQAIKSLYGIAFGIKMGLKFNKMPKPKGYFDFKMPPLEGLWWQQGVINPASKEAFEWSLMIMMPNYVTKELLNQARLQVGSKHPLIPYSLVSLQEFEEGSAIQTVHVGSYATEDYDIERLQNYAKKYHYEIAGKHHEIYISNPRITKTQDLKTVLRYPVRLNK